jgi:hypothetical protein
MDSQSMSQESKIVFDLNNGQVAVLTYTHATEFDINNVVEIDYNNLLGEFLTSPTIFNQAANIKAEAGKKVREYKFLLELTYDRLFRECKKEHGKDIPKILKEEMEGMVRSTEEYQSVKLELLEAEYQLDIMENLYWSLKEKCNKLDNIYHRISPDEFAKDIMEGQVNNVMIKIKKSVM